MADAGFYTQGQDETNKTLDRVKEVEAKLEVAYKRWDELEALLG
jgi:hypothetical protein